MFSDAGQLRAEIDLAEIFARRPDVLQASFAPRQRPTIVRA